MIKILINIPFSSKGKCLKYLVDDNILHLSILSTLLLDFIMELFIDLVRTNLTHEKVGHWTTLPSEVSVLTMFLRSNTTLSSLPRTSPRAPINFCIKGEKEVVKDKFSTLLQHLCHLSGSHLHHHLPGWLATDPHLLLLLQSVVHLLPLQMKRQFV